MKYDGNNPFHVDCLNQLARVFAKQANDHAFYSDLVIDVEYIWDVVKDLHNGEQAILTWGIRPAGTYIHGQHSNAGSGAFDGDLPLRKIRSSLVPNISGIHV